VIDRLLDGAMTNALDLGMYPVEPGSYRIFPNSRIPRGKFWQSPRPKAVIVVGLGQEGKLQSAHVVHSVRQSVLAWAERQAEQGAGASPMSLATTLLSSGGTGVSPGQAAQLIAQGVYEANLLIRRSAANRLPVVCELRFVELYLVRATDAWEALKMLAHASPDRYRVKQPIIEGTGGLVRPLDSGYRGAEYDFITAGTRLDKDGNSFIAYSLDTKRARTEVRAQAMQGRLLRDLIATASSDRNLDPQIGLTLYNLLVPLELEAFLANSGETQIEVDEGTAGIPWELLDDAAQGQADHQPWAIRSKLLRKFRTEDFRPQVNDADIESSVLIIGEPQCPPNYPPLPGALDEARQVFELLTSERGLDQKCVKALFSDGQVQGPDARQVVDALFERSWRIVHIAGHGEPVSAKENRGGVVLSNDTFLGASEIKAMRVTPELVFINCCHLGAITSRSVLRDQPPTPGMFDRAAFASTVAQALINIGVRCVVAAGWAVDDGAANAFATTFYEALLRGQRFLDAVGEARAKAFEFDGNTWAAYQCYGDPDWRLKRDPDATAGPRQARADEFDNVGSLQALELALQTIIVQSTYQGYTPSYQLDRLKRLEERWQAMGWTVSGDIAELFAQAYRAANDMSSAIDWYGRAIDTTKGDVSFKLLEEASNLRMRNAVGQVDVLRAEIGGAPPARKGGAAGRRSAAQQKADGKRLRAAIESARTAIADEKALLDQLVSFQETSERESLRGSVMKRLARLEAGAGRTAAARRAIEAMAAHYRRAYEIDRERNEAGIFYPAINLIAAELALNAGAPKWKGVPVELFDKARSGLAEKNRKSPDFWSLVAEPELRLYEAASLGTLSEQHEVIVNEFRDVFKRSQGGTQWRSVLDTAHFVLDPYLRRAAPDDRKAGQAVLDCLKEFAEPKPVAEPSVAAVDAPGPKGPARAARSLKRRTAAAVRKRSPGRA
jgi:CHAT domain-containing protein